MDKLDVKKDYKYLYKASSKKATVVTLPAWHYIALRGTGAPDSDLFAQSIEALFTTAYSISMSYKNMDFQIEDFQPFVCPPLEGHWSTVDNQDYDGVDKSVFKWEIRIMMPSFVKPAHVEQAKAIAFKKKMNNRIKAIDFIKRDAGHYCVMTHVGSFDAEAETFEQMMAFVREKGYKRLSKAHEEIYLSDFRKVTPDKLKTVLAFEVEAL